MGCQGQGKKDEKVEKKKKQPGREYQTRCVCMEGSH